MKLGTAQILRGNALDLPLADATVDLIVTSPPYFGLRSYQDGGEHYDGQIGSEATPAEFVDALLAATAEMVRVLKPSGSLWVNLGDKYAGSSIDNRERPPGPTLNNPRNSSMRAQGVVRPPKTDVRPKSLIGIPWRYALACIDQLGLILRAEVIWAKPNGLPESVTDRVRRSHETWFHFVRQPRYFSAVDEIREEHAGEFLSSGARNARHKHNGTLPHEVAGAWRDVPERTHTNVPGSRNPLGKLPGSVWQIPTQPLTVPAHLGIDHFAAFPMEWPRRIIQGWSPSGVCTACGEGRRPVVNRPGGSWHDHESDGQGHNQNGRERKQRYLDRIANGQVAQFTGSYTCACAHPTAPTTPAIVLDPFGGTGTVALVAKALGRHGISLDMSADYCRLATWRTTDEGELARALQVEKPAKQIDGQMSLLEGIA